ncbi:MAG: Crp/Fnr family transcriptional regulator, partial [Caulobacteraceae bacterium]|nr:Crp/Fnr family transcriptional regulator [Caulobacteraceae bacterium]
MVQGERVFEPRRQARHVWFPHDGLISVVALGAEGQQVEVGVIGREGMTGAAIVLGGRSMTNEAMVQIRGYGSRMTAEAFRHLVDVRPTFKAVMLRYILAAFTQLSQNSACNQLHGLETRCARWLLTEHD